MFRVNPTNVGEYRMHQLPGRTNHGADQTGGRGTVFGELGRNRPEKTAYLPERLPTVRGRAERLAERTAALEGETRMHHHRGEAVVKAAREDGITFIPIP